MSWIDWAIVVAYLMWIVIDGLRRSKNTDKVEGYFLANRSLPWWAVGLSVMATQISAITLVGTTGQAYATGLRFVQFYFGLPIAMVILSLTVVPFFTRARVYTAYEYLERRFDVRVRTATSFLFLVGRAFSLGVTLAAPAVVISAILGWSIPTTVLVLSVPMVVYTSFGGVQAVAWTDVKQMVVIVIGLFAAIGILIFGITRDVGFGQALRLAGATGRLQAIDTRFDLSETYTLWSGLIGGLFLSLSYFGCDQSQVQRYLTAKSIDEARHSLLMSAFVKIPLQLLILGAGVLVFLFYVFQTPPMLFNRAYDAQIAAGPQAGQYAALQREFDATVAERRQAGIAENREQFLASDKRLQDIRARAVAVVKQSTGDERYTDVNYVFPDLHHDSSAGRPGRADDRGDLCRGHVGVVRRVELAVVGDDHRLLSAAFREGRRRCALPEGVEDRDARMGTVCLRRVDLRGEPGIADRSGQPLRVVLLRVDSRRVHPGDSDQTRHRSGRVLGTGRRHGRRAHRGVHDADRLSLAQPDRRRRGRRASGWPISWFGPSR